VFDSEDVVFAWAIGKALLIVMASVGVLVYVAWLATRTKEIARVDISEIDIPENEALRSSTVNASRAQRIGPGTIGAAEVARPILSDTSAEENDNRKPEQPAVAA
jgi:hypothetical protein